MRELFEQVMSYLRGGWRFRWYALLVAWCIALAGWTVVYTLPNKYESSARVYADADSMLGPLLKGLAIQPDVNNRVGLMARTLLSRPNLEKVSRETNLYLRAPTPVAMDRLLDRLSDSVEIRGGGPNNLYTISYDDKNPKMAYAVVNAFLNILMNDTLGTNAADTKSARLFLQQQIKDYSKRLTDAEQRLADFKKDHVGMMPNQGGKDYYSRLQEAEAKLANLKDQLQTATAGARAISGQLHGMETGNTTGVNALDPRLQAITKQINAAQAQLNRLLLKYTDDYPDVVALKSMIKRLINERVEVRKQVEDTSSVGISSDNIVYQNLQTELYNSQVKIRTLQSQINQQETLIKDLKKKVDEITDVEAKLASLNRDYSVTKKQYDNLLVRLDTAQMSQDATHSGNNLKFRIIDPPTTPLLPVSPLRGLLLSVVLIFSIGAGCALAIFLFQVRPVLTDRYSLKHLTGRPVLGSVTRIWTDAQRRRRRLGISVFSTGVALLLAVYGICLVFSTSFTHLVQNFLAG